MSDVGIVSGHTSCAGCGEVLGMRMVMKALGQDTIVANATGCSEIFTSKYPQSNWTVPWIHSLFENTPAVATGIRAALHALGREGEARVLCLGGDGALADIGFGALSGSFDRNEDFITVCLDNEAYMNTGIQKSGMTPFGAKTMTTPPGKLTHGNLESKKDLVSIAVAHHIPYAASASIAYPADLQKKLKKAASMRGSKFIHLHVPCPLGWGSDPARTVDVARLAVTTCLYPLVEFVDGQLTSVKKVGMTAPVEDYLRPQSRFRHLFQPHEDREALDAIQAIADANAAKYGLLTTNAKQED